MSEDQNQLFTQLRDDIRDIKNALVGNEGMKTTGVIQRLSDMEKKWEDHETSDTKNFQALFDFQERQKMLLGWSRWGLGVIGSALILIGGLIGWTITTLIIFTK